MDSGVLLFGKTKKGKEKVKRWGEDWSIIRRERGKLLIFADVDDTADVYPPMFPASMRWVDEKDDADFTVIIKESKDE